VVVSFNLVILLVGGDRRLAFVTIVK